MINLTVRAVSLMALLLFPQGTNTPPKDRKIGEAMFHIGQQGEDVVMMPMLVPSFKMHRLDEGGPIATDIVKCGVWERENGRDEARMVVYTVTVIKCPSGAELVVAEVYFRYETEKSETDMPVIEGGVSEQGRGHEAGARAVGVQ